MFIVDIRKRKFKTEEDFDKIMEDYYDGVVFLVSFKQKTTIAGFFGNMTRYIDPSGYPFFSRKDILTYDGIYGSSYIVTKEDLVHFGETFESEITRIVMKFVKKSVLD